MRTTQVNNSLNFMENLLFYIEIQMKEMNFKYTHVRHKKGNNV